MLPESSVSGNARRLAVTDISEAWLAGVAIRAELSKAVTRNGSPTGLPDAGAKWIPHTLKNPPRCERKKIVLPSGDQRGLSSRNLPVVICVCSPPEAGMT